MKLHNGQEVDVAGEITLEGKKFVICKLKYVTYVNGTMVRYINLPMSEFADYRNEVKKQSDEITYMMGAEDGIVDRRKVSETDQSSIKRVQEEERPPV